MKAEQTAAAERMRRMRERRKGAVFAAPIIYERHDWRLFCDRLTLPQKAGCEPGQIGWVLMKELIDNGLDAGVDDVAIHGDARTFTVCDDPR
jgi:hypothetical protein